MITIRRANKYRMDLEGRGERTKATMKQITSVLLVTIMKQHDVFLRIGSIVKMTTGIHSRISIRPKVVYICLVRVSYLHFGCQFGPCLSVPAKLRTLMF